MALIQWQRSIIPACDVDSLEKLAMLVSATAEVPYIGGYKVGLELAIPFGLTRVVQIVRRYSRLPIIYDHQKAGNDIPELGDKFARAVKASGADAAILFPFSSPLTEEDWIKACQDRGLVVIVGGHMTHKKFLQAEGGFIANDAPERIYETAAKHGVRDFVVPGNKVDLVAHYSAVLADLLGEDEFTLYAPGFVAQGGNISETGKEAGDNWHAIVGTALYKYNTVEETHAAAIELTSQIAA